jgi:hypothetical protein
VKGGFGVVVSVMLVLFPCEDGEVEEGGVSGVGVGIGFVFVGSVCGAGLALNCTAK